MFPSEKALRICCLTIVGVVLVSTTIAVLALVYADRRPCMCQVRDDDTLVLAIIDATRAMDELASTIVDAERFGKVIDELAFVRKELGGVKLRAPFVYPLIFRRVQGSYDQQQIEELRGVHLEDVHENRLKSLVNELEEHCGTYGMPIALEVYGYSSELPFQNEEDERSEALNVKAANSRAENIAVKLKDLVENAQLECEVSVQRCVWPEYDSFDRPDFFDRHKFPWKLREVVGRTVFVRPAGDGECDHLTEQ